VTPVCAPLPVYRETLGDSAVYADTQMTCISGFGLWVV
jgi:hypothetical protein